jgi:ribonuclease T1
VRGILRDRRTFAAVLVMLVVVSAVIGSLRNDDDGDSSDDAGPPKASIPVTESPTPSGSASPSSAGDPSEPDYPTAVAPSPRVTDPESGLTVVLLADLPPEAAETVDLIEQGGPFLYPEDGIGFLNSEGLLPAHEVGYYRVYTVQTPGSTVRGPLRIVAGTGGEFYWTDQSFKTFRRIEE